ncbi:MAG TPA: DUF5522 domain-containing protein [Pyrinomonadaceae bacterium]|nr:DUF5522 domain-containing protein [Pyrinomonadaceae bacterium]
MEEQSDPQPLIPDEDYYLENGLMVMTSSYHIKRGICCGTGCRWCPFDPKHELGTTRPAMEFTIAPIDEPRT